MSAPAGIDQDLFDACIAFVPRTGATEFQVRYQDDERPTVWVAVAGYSAGRYETAAALSPDRAVTRLLEQLVDGGQCQHCKRPTGFTPDFEAMPANALVCWYQFDPELKKIRRGCA